MVTTRRLNIPTAIQSARSLILRTMSNRAPAVGSHCDLLRAGVPAFNKWRSQAPDTPPQLQQATFEEKDLSNVNLESANLVHTNFRECNLSNAVFEDSDLSKATFFSCNLTNANFQNSSLVIAHPRGWLVQAGRGIGFPWRVRRMASMARIERRRAVSTTERMSA